MEGWVDLGHPVMHRPTVELAIYRSQVRRPNHYTIEPPILALAQLPKSNFTDVCNATSIKPSCHLAYIQNWRDANRVTSRPVKVPVTLPAIGSHQPREQTSNVVVVRRLEEIQLTCVTQVRWKLTWRQSQNHLLMSTFKSVIWDALLAEYHLNLVNSLNREMPLHIQHNYADFFINSITS